MLFRSKMSTGSYVEVPIPLSHQGVADEQAHTHNIKTHAHRHTHTHYRLGGAGLHEQETDQPALTSLSNPTRHVGNCSLTTVSIDMFVNHKKMPFQARIKGEQCRHSQSEHQAFVLIFS